ncbi:creatininase family protein [Inquilinus sp. CAU 1745]|uniref:creatininase family protein n=1 Tax=Inquilinus sp. CAU 1745 TaxID=3140369 RepID=UPI00325B0FEB
MRRWQDLTTEDFAGLDPERTVAVLPVAAIEQHGPHLPLSVDADINAGIIDRAMALAADDLPALVLPTQAIGSSGEHSAFAGTLSLHPGILGAALAMIVESAAAAGVRKFLFFNSHGGNPPALESTATDLRARRGLFVATAHWFAADLAEGLFPAEEIAHGIHGGAVETSVMLHLRPELVRRDRLKDFPSLDASLAAEYRHLRALGSVSFGWQTQDLNPSGAVGDARDSDEERGRMLVDRAARRLIELLEEIARFPLSALKS